jgi:8-oxo-dGTP pyrophosphatase MutT (NUDIX family)
VTPDSKRTLARWIRTNPLLLYLMRIVAYVKAPRQSIGAVGAVFDDAGRVLIVEHVFRTDFPWGLPGGWVERGEDPEETVRRELEEELKIRVQVKELLMCSRVGLVPTSTHPPHLGLAYYCRHISGSAVPSLEVASAEWCNPTDIGRDLAPFQLRAVEMGLVAFNEDR